MPNTFAKDTIITLFFTSRLWFLLLIRSGPRWAAYVPPIHSFGDLLGSPESRGGWENPSQSFGGKGYQIVSNTNAFHVSLPKKNSNVTVTWQCFDILLGFLCWLKFSENLQWSMLSCPWSTNPPFSRRQRKQRRMRRAFAMLWRKRGYHRPSCWKGKCVPCYPEETV